MVAELADGFCHSIAKVYLLCNIDNTEDALYADINQIQQVIYNLIINAGEASTNNEEIYVGLRIREIHHSDSIDLRPGRYFEISIKDHGIGMTDVQKEEIFKPYFTTKKHGHGLGLSACLTTVTNHNGIIHVKSKEGLGSTFTVFLPVFIQHNEVKLVHQPFSNELIYGSGRVLYIEDDPDTQAATLEMLQEIGYEVQCYSSMKPAISYIEEQPDGFDIVITDYILNDFVQGGAEILDSVRDIRPNCPVILITGYYKQLEKRSTTSHQFSYIVQKPVSFVKISQIISRCINNVDIDCENRNLPRMSDQASAEITSIVDVNKTDIEQTSANKRNILVVDDDRLVASFLKSYLTYHNYNVTTAPNGHLALEILGKQPVDLVITDQSMPNMTGMELSQKVKKLLPNIPIILNSGYGDEIIELNVQNVGINHFHKKSSNPEELIDAITKLL